MDKISEATIPDEILQAYDLLLQYRIIDEITSNLKLDVASTIKRWVFQCNIRLPFPNKKGLPEVVKLEIKLYENFPFSKIECYSLSEEIKGFPHQDAESGKLCLKDERLAPLNENKLVIYISWAKEWLTDAANDTLIKPTDPYELPDFSRKLFRKSKQFPTTRIFLFDEDSESYKIWQHHIGEIGKVRCNKADNMNAIFISEYLREESIPVYKSIFSETLYEKKYDLWGYWVIVKSITYKNHRPPQTFGEIRKLFSLNELNFNYLLKKAWEANNKNLKIGFLLVGFPIPKYFGGEPIEIHWVPLIFHNSNYSFIESKTKKKNKLWNKVFQEEHNEKYQLPWGKSLNISHNRLFSRGSFSNLLQNKKICLFGCGALGSQVAENLVRGGQKSILLFDGDQIQQVNLCRHTLDGRDSGNSKSFSLGQRFQSINPFANIEAYYTDIPLSSMEDKEFKKLEEADLFIDCTTDDSAFMWLNEFAISKGKRLITIFLIFMLKF